VTHLICPTHVKSADVGSAIVVLDIRTGVVEVISGWGRILWLEQVCGARPEGAVGWPAMSSQDRDSLTRQWCSTGLLVEAETAQEWEMPTVPPTRPSWGTQEVPAALPPRLRLSTSRALQAGLACGTVLIVRAAGRRCRAFARLLRVITLLAHLTWRPATAEQASQRLHWVRSFASILPCRFACLEETAAAVLLLALRGRGVGWCHGIAADPIRLHAWLVVEGRPVAEPDSTNRYAPLLSIRGGNRSAND
jgi:Transglutaminase-like superfamily